MSKTPSNSLTTAEAAEVLRRSVITLERWRRERRGPPFFYIEGRVQYDEADLYAWREQQKADSYAKRAAPIRAPRAEASA